jgi:hypothetical protein
MVSPEVVQGHTMSQEQFPKYRPCSCHATGHPLRSTDHRRPASATPTLDSLIGGQHLPPAAQGQR